jgi:hypothetical protein
MLNSVENFVVIATLKNINFLPGSPGPLAGVQLEAISSRVSFRFAIVYPELGIEVGGR